MFMAQLIWFPRIHWEIVLKAQRCIPCRATGKNLNTLIPENTHTKYNSLTDPNEELHLEFTGPIIENNKDTYIIVSIDRYSRYPHAEAYYNCETETVLSYLKSYIKFDGIPRTIRCDQAQAFKLRNFEIFCKDSSKKLIIAPVGDLQHHLLF